MLDTDSFQILLERLFSEIPNKSELQKKAWQVFQKLGLPTKKQEDFQKIPLAKLYEKNQLSFSRGCQSGDYFDKILPGFSEKNLFLQDGNFQSSSLKSLPEEVVVLPLEKARDPYGFFLQSEWKKKVLREKDPFTFLNEAFGSQGVFLYFPDNLGKLSLQVIHLFTQPCFSSPKLQLMVGKNTEVTLYEAFHFAKEAQNFFCNASLEVHLQSAAKVDHKKIVASSSGKILSHISAHLEEQSDFSSFALNDSSSLLKNRYSLYLTKENANVSLEGLSLVAEKDFSETQVEMHHQSPNTTSHQNFKTAIKDQGTFSFNGLIQIESAAQKTNAYQLVKSLLMGEKAVSFAKPQLKIFADDVKASHGATIGKLSKDELFYLQTRGIAKEKAAYLLTLAFMQELKSKAGLYSPNFDQILQKWICDR